MRRLARVPALLSVLGPTLVLAGLLAPQTTHACDPAPCSYSVKWQELDLHTTSVATDGVLVFDARRSSNAISDTEALAYLSAEVTADGQVVTGAFEAEDGWAGLVWRPDAPFPADAALSVTLSVDYTGLEEDGCEPDPALGPFAATVTAGPLPELNLDAVDSAAVGPIEIRSLPSLDTLVCCDGAFPGVFDSCGESISWAEGTCAATVGETWLASEWTVDYAQLAPELAQNLGWRVVTDSAGDLLAQPSQTQIDRNQKQALCGQVQLHNWATGDDYPLPDVCFGEGETFGEVAIDPSEGLSECVGDPYTCETNSLVWDEEACEPWEDPNGDGDGDPSGDGDGDPSGDGDGDPSGDGDGDPTGDGDGDGETGGEPGVNSEDGCSCTTDGSPSGSGLAGLGLLGLLGLRRRRSPTA